MMFCIDSQQSVICIAYDEKNATSSTLNDTQIAQEANVEQSIPSLQ